MVLGSEVLILMQIPSTFCPGIRARVFLHQGRYFLVTASSSEFLSLLAVLFQAKLRQAERRTMGIKKTLPVNSAQVK